MIKPQVVVHFFSQRKIFQGIEAVLFSSPQCEVEGRHHLPDRRTITEIAQTSQSSFSEGCNRFCMVVLNHLIQGMACR